MKCPTFETLHETELSFAMSERRAKEIKKKKIFFIIFDAIVLFN